MKDSIMNISFYVSLFCFIYNVLLCCHNNINMHVSDKNVQYFIYVLYIIQEKGGTSIASTWCVV